MCAKLRLVRAGAVVCAKLHLVDLAGSERVKESGVEGQVTQPRASHPRNPQSPIAWATQINRKPAKSVVAMVSDAK